jgi:hypothetical protein
MIMRTLGFAGFLVVGIIFIGSAVVALMQKSGSDPASALALAACGIGAMIGAVAFAVSGELLDGSARTPRPGPHPQMMAGPQAGAYPQSSQGPQGYAPPMPGGQAYRPYAPAPQGQGLPGNAPQRPGIPQQHGDPYQHADPQQQSDPQRPDHQ